MFYKMVLCVLLPTTIALGAAGSGAKPPADDPNESIALPAKNTAEYWVLRSEAQTDLVRYMTQKRADFQDTHKRMLQFLDSIGKGEDFVRSGVKAPDTPEVYVQALGIADQIKASGIKLSEKPATWEQFVEAALQFKLREGYLPTRVADAEELALLQKGCEQKEVYGQKVRKELRDIVKKCMDIWFYLGTIDRQADCKVYVYRERENERKAKEEAAQQARDQRAAAGREMRARQQYEKAMMRNEQMWASHYRRMNAQYYNSGYRW